MAEDKRESFYDLLGVAPDASPGRIKATYRGLARRYHPDVQQAAAACGAAPQHDAAWFKRLTAAYHILSNPERRTSYDARLREENPPAAGRKSPPRPVRVRRSRRQDRLGQAVRKLLNAVTR